MPGFDYDVTNEEILLKLNVKNGKILTPGGIEYEVLVLPDHKVLSLTALEKIEELLQKGVHVIGYKPERLISLMGGYNSQKRFHELADKIWGENIPEKGKREYGKGSVTWGVSARDYLIDKGIKPDFTVPNNETPVDFDYIHYTVAGKDVYFISNQTEDRQDINGSFRISGFRPELWDALTGTIKVAKAFTQKDGFTTIPLTLEPYGSIFVVFNEPIDKNTKGTADKNDPDYMDVKEIKGPWTVHFDPKWGGPESIEFPELTDWSQHPDEGIKYYSGTAIYHKTFSIDFIPEKNKSYYLQLENVKDVGIAVVKINDKDKGIVWTKPFRVDISGDLKKGNNTLEIEIINSWYNRVAGDEISPDKKGFTSTNVILQNDFRGVRTEKIPLEPSGLIGPVKITEGRWE
jgi:hypothetical protein